jgi:DUF1365 family protein
VTRAPVVQPVRDRQRVDVPTLPALVRGAVHHTRHRPVRHEFTHAHTAWLVDLDEGTRLPRGLARFTDVHPSDHLEGAPTFAQLKAAVLARVAAEGVDTTPVTRVVMLAHARVLGHVFDPLSTYWCLDADGLVVAVALEVRNTYGGRRTYVVQPTADGRAGVEKDFVVSPFNGVEGTYAVRTVVRDRRVAVWIRLTEDGELLLTAGVWGTPVPATTPAVLRALVTSPLMTQRVSALIRWHGILLWARRLPIRTTKEHRS